MPGIFISYRRDDSAGFAGRLADALAESFPGLIFIDVTAIAPGVDFRQAIEESVSACDALLAVIGRTWSTGSRPRLQEAHDLVRLEVASALRRGIAVIPVLVDGASMPTAENLPAELEPLAWRNAVELRHTHWEADVQELVGALRKILPERDVPERPADRAVPLASPVSRAVSSLRSRRRVAAAVAVAVILTGLALLRPWRGERAGRAASYPATLPLAPDVTVSTARYQMLSARLERVNEEHLRLAFVMRMTNQKEQTDNLWAESFHLIIDGAPLPPADPLNELVDGYSAREGELTFLIDPGTTSAVLQVTHDQQSTRIPIDLTAAVPGTPAPPARSRLAGPFPMALATGNDVRADGIRYQIVSAGLARDTAEQLALTLSVRMTNERQATANFHDASFRLLVDGVPRAPAGSLNELVAAGSASQHEVRFVFDDTVESLVLLVGDGQNKTRIPLGLRR